MSDKKMPAPTQGLGICRAKYWHEMTADEKIEALGHTVEDLSAQVRAKSEEIDLLRLHTHGEGGKLMAPLDATHPRAPEWRPPHYHPNPLNRERR